MLYWIFFNTPLAVYLSSTQQIEYLTAQYTTAKNKVLSDLDSKSNPALSPFSTGRRVRLEVMSEKLCAFFFLFSTDIGAVLGGRIHSQLEKEVVPSLDTALRMAGGSIPILAQSP